MKSFALILLLVSSHAYASTITYKNVYSSVNQERMHAGVAPLRHSKVLDTIAEQRLQYISDKNYFTHYSVTGLPFFYWFRINNYTYLDAGENLAKDFASNEDQTQAWMNSPTHRQNVLSLRYTETGIATNGVITVQEFGGIQEKSSALAREPLSTR